MGSLWHFATRKRDQNVAPETSKFWEPRPVSRLTGNTIGDRFLCVQSRELIEVAELRRDGSNDLIHIEVPARAEKLRMRMDSDKECSQWIKVIKDYQNDAIVNIQHLQFIEVAELGWDGATELIRVEGPVKRQYRYDNAQFLVDHKHFVWIRKDILGKDGERWAMVNIQIVEASEIAELRRDGTIKLSCVEAPERAQ